MAEFDIISRYFSRSKPPELDVGIGDDAAVFRCHGRMVMTMDAMNQDVHFFKDCDPYLLGFKAVAVNVSDVLAMGATAKWYCLSLALPANNSDWLSAFNQGLLAAEHEFSVSLIGGDTTQGPLSIAIQMTGLLTDDERAICRNGAKPGDGIYVTAQLGRAKLALHYLQGKERLTSEQQKICLEQLYKPNPNINYRTILQSYATSAIDISDGLSQDLSHICRHSQLGADIDSNALPIHPAVLHTIGVSDSIEYILSAGDEYALCFTVASNNETDLINTCSSRGLSVYRIGTMTNVQQIMLYNDTEKTPLNTTGWQHFDTQE